MEYNLVDGLRTSIEQKDYLVPLKTNLFKVYDTFVGKRSRYQNGKEFMWGEFLLENDVRVPEMHQLISGADLGIGDEDQLYTVMDKIEGRRVGELEGSELEEAIRQFRVEIKKVLNLGLYPDESDTVENSIFGDDGKLYLIDFEEWECDEEQFISEFDDMISDPNFMFFGYANLQRKKKRLAQGT